MTSDKDDNILIPTTINFTKRDYDRMEKLIRQGIFATKSEVVRQALKLLLDQYEEE